MNNQYEINLKQIKRDASDRTEEEKHHIIEKNNEQYRRLTEGLVEFYEGERIKLKIAKEAEIREL